MGVNAQGCDPSAGVNSITFKILHLPELLGKILTLAFLWLKVRSAVLHLLPVSQSPFIKHYVNLGCAPQFGDMSGGAQRQEG